jgi:hypothetical protein
MTLDALSELPDHVLLCYCTSLTMGGLREAGRTGTWPPFGKENTGKLCTGCLGDLQLCLRHLGIKVPADGAARGASSLA